MSTIARNLDTVKKILPEAVTLVAVSKTKPITALMEAYEAGQRIFGENKIQEMVDKQAQMPEDIQWHMIGHVQRNKVKYMAPFVDLIHGVDSLKLLQEINKQAAKHQRVIRCLLQIKIAEEDSKFGMTQEIMESLLASKEVQELGHIAIVGLMGMATFTADEAQLQREFTYLGELFGQTKAHYPQLEILSMGMSGDYPLAIDCGSTMVRVGSAIFGARNYG